MQAKRKTGIRVLETRARRVVDSGGFSAVTRASQLSLRLAACLLSLVCAGSASAQTITSLAGNISAADGLKARQTPLVFCRAVVADQNGFLYIGDDGSGTVHRVDPSTGIATIIAGGGTVVDDSIPVPAKSVYINTPVAVALGPGGNVYITDDAHQRIRLLTPDGLVRTVAGNGTDGFSGDGGLATSAQLSLPTGIAVDARGNLYIADRGNYAIRKVDAATGRISTLAGGPNATRTGDGIPATSAMLDTPEYIAVDSSGNVFFTDAGDRVARRIDAVTGLISTVAGNGSSGSSGDGGPATSATLSSPRGIAVAANGDLYIGVSGRVRRVSASTRIITTVLGNGNYILSEGRAGTDVYIPDGVDQVSLAGNVLLVGLSGDNLIAQVDLNTGVFSIVAGSPQVVGDGGPAVTAALSQPQKLALDATGNLFVVDKFHHRIRRISPGAGGVGTGNITTVAGIGIANDATVGSAATSSTLWFPDAVFVDPSNNLYFTEDFSRVLKVGSDGMIRAFAGSATQGFGGDGGPATSAQLNAPKAVTRDTAGNFYIADTGNNRVRRVDPNGIIQTIAGTGTAGFSGDGGLAASAQLNDPWDLLLDGRGGLLIADRFNNRVRRLNLSTGIITTFGGTGAGRTNGDGGLATAAGMYDVRGLAMDAQGNIYASHVNTVRRIDAVTGVITTVAGTGDPGLSGDGGLATLARLSGVQGVVVDSSGNLIIADTVNDRIRRVSAARVAPVLAVSSTALTFSAIQGGASPGDQSVQIGSGNLVSTSWTASVRLNSGSGWLSVRPASGVTPGVLVVSVSSSALAAATYTASISIAAPSASNSPQTITVTLNVTSGGNPRLAIDQQFITFRASQGGSNPPTQTVNLTNAGGGTLRWSTAVLTSNGGNWLSISPSSGTGAATLTLSATSGSLAVGVYQGLIQVSNLDTGEGLPLSVTFIVSQPVASLALSQTGLVLTVNEGGTFVPSESILVLNAGQGLLNWQAQAISLSGGNWLNLSPPGGTSAAGLGASLSLAASPGGLRAGIYDALVTVTASSAGNSPQVLLARLNVQPASTPPLGRIRPGGLALLATAGGSTVQDTVTISSSGGSALNFLISASTSDGANWLTVTPAGGTLQSSADSATITVSANPAQLAAGAYRGRVAVSFSTGVTQDVAVLFVARPPGTAAATRPAEFSEPPPPAAAACTAAQLFPLVTSMVNNFSPFQRYPTPILVRVLDNCGASVNNAAVFVSFTNGDNTLTLKLIQDGFYSDNWTPQNKGATSIRVVATAQGLTAGRADLDATVVGGPLATVSNPPAIYRRGAVNGASFKATPLAPGQIFSIFGVNLAKDRSGATTVPLPRTLAGATAQLGATEIPLYYASDGQVNAQVPFSLPPGDTFPLFVKIAGTASPPELVTVSNTSPGIFTVDSSGKGAGVITDASGSLISASNPAHRDDVVVVYATGLGATNPAVSSGDRSPSDPPARVIDAVSVYLGGSPASGGIAAPVEFAGLTPGFVGLYQVNVRIPSNATLGDTVEIYLQQNQILSGEKVTLVIR